MKVCPSHLDKVEYYLSKKGDVVMHSIWELGWYWYLFGFCFTPRLTIMLIFKNYVSGSFDLSTWLVGFTIWWKFSSLALGAMSKLGFSICYFAFPRLLLGVIGYNYLSHDNHNIMIFLSIVGLAIDLAARYFSVIGKMQSRVATSPA